MHKGNSQKEQTEITEITVEDQPQIEPEPEIAEPIPPQAQEEEVVVVEQAEIVVPEQPPVTPEKPKDINYKIKWGDTLWDIADTYYKNPWRLQRYFSVLPPLPFLPHKISENDLMFPILH